MKNYNKIMEQLEAENKRLQHALLRIKSNIPYNDRHTMMKIAEEALKENG